jgi:hypothetical protein
MEPAEMDKTLLSGFQEIKSVPFFLLPFFPFFR